MSRKFAYMVLLHLFCSASDLIGQQPDTLALQEVEVSGTSIRNPQGATPIQRLEAKELQRITGNTLADALRHFAGVHLKDYGGIGGLKTVQVRSLGAQHTGVFVDGVPLSDAATGQIDLGRLIIDLADDLSLSTGSSPGPFYPARWFAQASALSLNTINPNRSAHNLKAHAALKWGSFDLMQASTQIETKLSPSTSALWAARYLQAKGAYPYRLSNGTNEWLQRQNSDVQHVGLQAKIIRKTKKTQLDYGALFDHSLRGLPGAVTFYNPFASQRLTNNDLNQHLRLNLNGKQWHHQAILRHALMHLNYVDPDFLNPQGYLEQNYYQHELYLSQLSGKNLDKLHLALSNDFTFNRLDALHLTRNPARFTWHQLLSAQWQQTRWEADAHLLWWHAWELRTPAGASVQYHPLSPGFGLAWRTNAASSSKLRFLFKETFRLPTFNELYYNIVGNPQLKPERASMFNLGWVGQTHLTSTTIEWKLDLYHNDLRNQIIAIPTKNLFVWSMRNIGKVSSTGLELGAAVQKNISNQWRWMNRINYTFQKAIDRSSPSSPSYGHQIQYLPVHALNNFSMLSNQHAWFAIAFYHNSVRYFLPENISTNSLPAWGILDLSFGHTFKGSVLTFDLKAELNNLLNTQYELIRSFPMPGRSFNFTLSTRWP